MSLGSGFYNGTTMFADNVSFDGTGGKTPAVTTNGQLLIGSTVAPNIRIGTLTSPNSTLLIGFSSPNITIQAGTGASIASFFAYNNADIDNVTGDNTAYRVILNSTRYNIGAGYNVVTGVFTAPITGIYNFTGTATCKGLAPANTTGKVIFLLNNTDQMAGTRGNFGSLEDAGGNFQISFAMNIQMTVGETMQMLYQVDGGAKIVGLFGVSPSPITIFTGTMFA